jgi:hypothetical protein
MEQTRLSEQEINGIFLNCAFPDDSLLSFLIYIRCKYNLP